VRLNKNAVRSRDYVYWMGWENFFAYNGVVQAMTCEVQERGNSR
jgi:hypothetical protein